MSTVRSLYSSFMLTGEIVSIDQRDLPKNGGNHLFSFWAFLWEKSNSMLSVNMYDNKRYYKVAGAFNTNWYIVKLKEVIVK